MEAEAPLLVAVTSLPGADGGAATAAAVGVALARSGASRSRSAWSLSTPSRLHARARRLSPRPPHARSSPRFACDLPAVARGALCAVSAAGDALAGGDRGVAACTERPPWSYGAIPTTWRELVDTGEVGAAVLRADTKASRPLTALAARELIASGIPTGVVPRPPGLVATRRALAGIEPGGELGLRAAPTSPGGSCVRRTARRRRSRCSSPWRSIVAGVLLAILGSAATGASRFQRAADLAAVSAARSMRDDHHRLFLPRGASQRPSEPRTPERLRVPAAGDRCCSRGGCGERRSRGVDAL